MGLRESRGSYVFLKVIIFVYSRPFNRNSVQLWKILRQNEISEKPYRLVMHFLFFNFLHNIFIGHKTDYISLESKKKLKYEMQVWT